ncbi:MAG: inositol monophosphatase family protein [Myxococcota bacterium]|nr:inositol monophosphatase family protein [Myxococcota bacterium]
MTSPSPALPGAPVDEVDALLRPLLLAAGELALDGFRRVRVDRKQDGSVVTAVDRGAECLLFDGLRAAFPRDGIKGEEGATHQGGPAYWVVDPLDGTLAFTEGLAHWGPSLARIREGRIDAGATWLPRTRDHFYVRDESEAFLDGARLAPLPTAAGRPRGSIFLPSRFLFHVKLDWPGRVRGLGSIAAHLALVATGGVEACIVGPGWSPWDTATGMALIRAVGGQVRALDGAPLDFLADVGIPFVAGTARATEWVTAPGRIAFLSDRGHRG